jgi:3-methylfumaryl-CoA hydratase
VSAAVERTELLAPGPAEALAALLDVPAPDDELPLLWHWLYLLERPAQADLGPDGHPSRGSIPAPPEPGRRRMFAGGRVRSLAPLRCGEPATHRTEVLSTQEKHGRSGRLTFVTVGQQIIQGGQAVIDERQDIVYRDMADTPVEPEPEAVTQPPDDSEWSIDVTPTLLFRFSALTYNGHRIHYDRDYARDIEGYPGLVTHGPLQALAMTEAARAAGAPIGAGTSCDYRLVAPLFEHQGLIVRATREDGEAHAAVRDITGHQTAHATITTIATSQGGVRDVRHRDARAPQLYQP